MDAVLSDLVMPEMRGTELVREITRVSPATCCLLMTGGVDLVEVPPDVPVLRKPFSQRHLVSSVELAVERSAELRARFQESMDQSSELRRECERLASEWNATIARSAELIAESRLLREKNRYPPVAGGR